MQMKYVKQRFGWLIYVLMIIKHVLMVTKQVLKLIVYPKCI